MKETKKVKEIKRKGKIKDKKLNSFIINNFPEFEDIELIKEENAVATVRLDYGKSNPMLDVDICLAPDNEKYAIYKLVDTRFVY